MNESINFYLHRPTQINATNREKYTNLRKSFKKNFKTRIHSLTRSHFVKRKGSITTSLPGRFLSEWQFS